MDRQVWVRCHDGAVVENGAMRVQGLRSGCDWDLQQRPCKGNFLLCCEGGLQRPDWGREGDRVARTMGREQAVRVSLRLTDESSSDSIMGVDQSV